MTEMNHKQIVEMKVYRNEKVIQKSKLKHLPYSFLAFSTPPYHLNNCEDDDLFAGFVVVAKGKTFQLIGYMYDFADLSLAFCTPELLSAGFLANNLEEENAISLMNIKNTLERSGYSSLETHHYLLEDVRFKRDEETFLMNFLSHVNENKFMRKKVDEMLMKKKLTDLKIEMIRIEPVEPEYEPKIALILGLLR